MFRRLRFLLILAAVLLLAGCGFRMLFPVPEAADRRDSLSLAPDGNSRLGGLVLPGERAHPGLSGVAPLQDGVNAFAARLQLAEMAERSFDVQYYIWQRDVTGILLLDAIARAAERGVRVRMLLDDNGVGELGAEMAELNAHPNIEIRLFNPFVLRQPRVLSFVFDFARVNRRMHNKSFTADGVASIVGGRNIGDIYFAQDERVNFFDMDVVALGPAARAVSDQFDLYWASPSAVPAELVLAPPVDGALTTALAEMRARPMAQAFEETSRALPLDAALSGAAEGFAWVPMTLVADDPAKGQGPVPEESLMIYRLMDLLPPVRDEVNLISAYFIPGDWLTGIMTGWAQSGRKVRILTNAQEATDVLPVHAAYRRYRDDLLASGVELFELKARQERRDLAEQFGLIGSTNSSLHAKTFVIDRETLFVGSFNFDPRSALLNTEMGFLIRHPDLARLVARGFDRQLAGRAYRVERTSSGALQWREVMASGAGDTRVRAPEPGTNLFSRALVRVIGWLPIEWLL